MIQRVFMMMLCLNSGFGLCCLAQASEGIDNKGAAYWQAHKGALRLEKGAVEISPDRLPKKIQKTLDGNDLYRGWRHSPLYFDQRAKLYTLYMKKDSTITAYGLNENGNAVTYNSYTVHED